MTTKQEQPQQEFLIHKIFTKDVSFESPNAPESFKAEWQPEANIELNTNSTNIENDIYEVELTITITAKVKEKTAFLIEIKQAGIFEIKGITDKSHMSHLLGSFCPSTIFPYAREIISNLAARGGFPPLAIAPINFDALYAQSLQQQAQK